MLSRRSGLTAGLTAATALDQKRFSWNSGSDGERWYGHLMDFDVFDYKFTGARPRWVFPANRDGQELQSAKDILPPTRFRSTYEMCLFDAARLNIAQNRKEFGNEIRIRLEKQANTVSRAQQLAATEQYNDQRTEDIMISRIIDEEHVQAEMKYVKCIRANEFAEDNRLDILPGGSVNSLREKTRWNLNRDLHPIDTAEIGARLQAWLPEKYWIEYFDDFQTVAAQSEEARADMKQVVKNVRTELAEEAKKNGWEADLDAVLNEVAGDVDPTDHITSEAIKNCSDLDTLEKWSRDVHQYNGDDRMLQIYEKAAEITKNPEHQALVKQMKELLAN